MFRGLIGRGKSSGRGLGLELELGLGSCLENLGVMRVA